MFRDCRGRNDRGEPCRARPLKDGQYCLMHDPEHVKEVAEARRLGGLRRKREVAVTGAYELNGLESLADIRRLVEIAVLDTLGMENSISRSRTLLHAAQVAAKLLETGELEERITRLEAVVASNSGVAPSMFDSEPTKEHFQSVESRG